MTVVAGIDWDAVGDALHAWVVGATTLSAQRVVWGQQDAPRPEGPAILMRISNITESGRPWQDTEANPLVVADKTISAIDTATNIFTSAAHTLLTADGPFMLTSTGTLPTATSVNFATDKVWLIKVAADTFQLAMSYANTGGGQGAGNPTTAIDILTAGTGMIKLVDTAETVRAGQELRVLSRGYLRATLELHCHSAAAVGNEMAVALLQRVRSRQQLPSQQQILQNANLGFVDADRVRAIMGTRDAVLFEPRAYLDVHIDVPFEDSEPLTVIERVQVTNLLSGRMFDVSLV